MTALLPIIGVLAGALTTLAGMGGGVFLLLVLSLVMSPLEALATTAPALLVGNLHRTWVMRAKIDRPMALTCVIGALPGSVAGAFLAAAMPETWLRVLLVVTALFALLRAAGMLKKPVALPALAVVPASFGIGAASATSGGAGLLLGPLLMSKGLSGEAYVATTASIAVALHIGRLVGYEAEGFVTRETLTSAALLMGAIVLGNVVGDRLRRRLSPQAGLRIESSVLVICVLLSLAGLH